MTLPRYRLHVELRNVEPPVRRVVEVPGHLSLADLHLVLQAAMGWEDLHPWRFEFVDAVFGQPELLDLPARDVHDTALWGLADLDPRRGDTLRYVYDFGDRWDHTVRVEQVLPSGGEAPEAPARVLEGDGRCPPEDVVGAPPTYAEALEALQDPSHPEHESWRERLGADFDPDAFSPDVANAALLALFEPGGRIGSVEIPLDPEVADALTEIFRLQDDRTEGEARVTDAVREVAEELLVLHAETEGGDFLRARKLATWAAGALHAAFQEFRALHARRDRMTLAELGDLFGVSSGSVGRRSRQLRETARSVVFFPFPSDSEAGRVLGQMLEGLDEGDGADAFEKTVSELAALLTDVPDPDAAEGEGEDGLELSFGDIEVVPANPPDTSSSSIGDEDDPPKYRAERRILIGEETGAPAPYREAARILEEHGDEMERESLKYLLQRGLETAPARAREPLMALAVRHFGTDVATWRPEGAGPWLEGDS